MNINVTKKELRKIVRENIAMRMTMDRMMKSDKDFSEPKYQGEPRKRKPHDPITKADVIKGSFEGTTSDRAELTKKLKKKIEKLIDQGYEKNVPSNWRDVLSHNDGDTLHALSKVVFPGFFGTIKRTLFPEQQLRRIIRQEILKEYGGMSRNDLPPRSSNYYEMAKALDIGVLDLDNIAYDLGFRDFRDMDASISPRALAERDPESFAVAVQDSSLAGARMGPNEILELVGAVGRVY